MHTNIPPSHAWTKSSYSPENGGSCVEFKKRSPEVVGIRDSKIPDGPRLAVSAGAWSSFVSAAAEADLP